LANSAASSHATKTNTATAIETAGSVREATGSTTGITRSTIGVTESTTGRLRHRLLLPASPALREAS
jgi:hypothetical protein